MTIEEKRSFVSKITKVSKINEDEYFTITDLSINEKLELKITT